MSRSALWQALVLPTLFKELRLVMTSSSWCQRFDFGCLQDDFWQGLFWKQVGFFYVQFIIATKF